jgi:hypothetical protein
VGSLNGEKRFRQYQDIARFNLILAKKLIDTKSVVNYDDHAKHAENTQKLKKMISSGNLRAEQYSMLGKSPSNSLEMSVFSNRNNKSKMLSSRGRLTPIGNETYISGKKNSARFKSRQSNVFKS